ncbi:MAG: glycosyltransferase family 2 protein [Candidatus Aenigmarchaeota archaeon]|nr:glycosyltransferase family 2 protein [Candidatus Aenigmarchaeota archaeon]
MKASVILPAYNEEKNIGSVIKNIPENCEVIVVDDGSKDRTLEVAKSLGCNCVRLGKNYGKGHACRVGAKIASSEKIVFIDSDGQLDAREIPRMLSALRVCDLAVGSRNIKDIPAQRIVSNNFAKAVISSAAGRKLNDVLCGFRAIRKGDFFNLNLQKKRYEVEAEMIIKAARSGLRIKEVPISVRYDIGSQMPVKDSLKVASYMLCSLLNRK